MSPRTRHLANLSDSPFAALLSDTSPETNFSTFTRQIPLTSDEIMSQLVILPMFLSNIFDLEFFDFW